MTLICPTGICTHKNSVYEALVDRLLEERIATRSALLAAEPEILEIGPTVSALIDGLLAIHLADPQLQHQLHRYEAAAGFERLERYEGQMRAVVAAQLERHREHFRPLDPALSARVLVHAVSAVVERMAREEPAMLERPEVRREVAALVAGYLSPLNPVESDD